MQNSKEVFNDLYNRIKRNADLYCKLYEHNKTPLVMSILVTNRCTLNCKHCFNHLRQGKKVNIPDEDELGLKEFEKISKSMGTFMKVLFSGGEPFVREDLKDIVLLFAENNNVSHISITTNGQNTDSIIEQTRYILSKLNNKVNLSLGFSLEGFEDIHDDIRGKGTFQRSIYSWNESKKIEKEYKNFDAYICSTINTINECEMSDFLQWAIDNLRPKSVALLKVRQNPRGGECLKDISLNNYYDSVKVIDDAIVMGKLGDRCNPQTYVNSQICKYVYNTLINNKRAFECFAGKYGGFINYNGDVGICEVLKPYANLQRYNYNFMELWNELLDSRYINRDTSECHLCTHETEGIIPSLFFGNNKVEYIDR